MLQLIKMNEGNSNYFEKISREFLAKLKSFEDNFADKMNSQKRFMKDLELR